MLRTTKLFKEVVSRAPGSVLLSKEQVRLSQKTLIEMADDIIGVCEEYNIRYALGGGNALGAIRHKGFIPWDDDLDLNILRDDFDLFWNKVKERFSDRYWFHNPQEQENHGVPFPQIRKKGTVARSFIDIGDNECGLNIDICLIENTYNNHILRNMHGVTCLGLGLIVSCCRMHKNKKELLTMTDGVPEAAKAVKKKAMIGSFFSWLSLEKWVNICNRCNCFCKNSSSRFVVVPTGRGHFFGELYERLRWCSTIKVDFNGRKWNITKDYDEYLKTLYGDYMKIPEKKHQEQHALIEFKL